MKSMNNTTREIKSQALLDEFAEILGFVQTAYQEGGTAYDVEIGLWRRILELGRQVYGAWLELFGDGGQPKSLRNISLITSSSG